MLTSPTATRTRPRLALTVLCLASFIAVVDTTIVSVALPSIQHELGFTQPDAQWILNGYALTFGGLLLLFGRAGDLWGRRRLFLAGLVVFAVAALLGGLAWEPSILIAARCLQGAAAAAFVPASLSLLTAAFVPGPDRDRAVARYGAMAALGFVVGMVGGGILTDVLGWRWVMFVNVPVALAAVVPTRSAVADSRDDSAGQTLDLPGAGTLTAGIAVVLYAVSQAASTGWGSPMTIALAVAGLGLLSVCLVVERRSTAPLVPLRLLARRAALVPNGAMFLQSMVGVAWLYVLTLYFQDVLSFRPLTAGLLFLPMTLASVIAATLAGRLATRFGIRATAVLGLALVIVGVALMTRMSLDSGLTLVIAGMIVGETGFMFSNVPLTIAGSTGTGEQSRGLSAGLLNTSSQLGNALGLAIVASEAASAGAPSATEFGPGRLLGGLQAGLYACAGFALAALLVAATGLPSRKHATHG